MTMMFWLYCWRKELVQGHIVPPQPHMGASRVFESRDRLLSASVMTRLIKLWKQILSLISATQICFNGGYRRDGRSNFLRKERHAAVRTDSELCEETVSTDRANCLQFYPCQIAYNCIHGTLISLVTINGTLLTLATYTWHIVHIWKVFWTHCLNLCPWHIAYNCIHGTLLAIVTINGTLLTIVTHK